MVKHQMKENVIYCTKCDEEIKLVCFQNMNMKAGQIVKLFPIAKEGFLIKKR